MVLWLELYLVHHVSGGSAIDWEGRVRRLRWTGEDRSWLNEGRTVAGTIFVGIFVLEMQTSVVAGACSGVVACASRTRDTQG